MELSVPCLNPDCDHETFVRIYPATREEPSYESTDLCEKCGEGLDFENADDADDFDDPRL